MFIRLALLFAVSFALSACSQCVTTDCGNGRSTTYCTKQGKHCDDCLNHKLTDENGNTLYGCEDSYENGKVVSCESFIKRDIADYCASGTVCTGLNGACSADSACCSGICGSVTRRCIAR